MNHESLLIRARFLAEAELKYKATIEEQRWLHEHPLLWLRVLIQLQTTVESHIAKDRLTLSSMKPARGEQASQRYLDEKIASDERIARRIHFINLVKRRKNEVIVLCGPNPVPLLGDVIAVMTKIMMLIDNGNSASARDFAHTCVQKWTDCD